MPNNYSNIYENLLSIQLNSKADYQLYLNMAEAFSGQTLTLTDKSDLILKCSRTSRLLPGELTSGVSTYQYERYTVECI